MSKILQSATDFQCGLRRILVLPDTNDLPAGPCEPLIDVPISLHGPTQLRKPVGRIPFGQRSVLRAAVPEAAIDENSESGADEDYVGSHL
jgi:hypothetical protein